MSGPRTWDKTEEIVEKAKVEILEGIENNSSGDIGGISEQLETLMIASLGAIRLCGLEGETFTLTNSNTGDVKTVTLDMDTPIGDTGLREKRIYVTLGRWSVNASIPEIGETNGFVEVAEVSHVYTFNYEIIGAEIAKEFTKSEIYIVPEEYLMLVGYACAAGGGGGGGCGDKFNIGGAGGGGGGACCKVVVPTNITRELSVTIGKGGAYGSCVTSIYGSNGSKGGSTVLAGSVNITLIGGDGGEGCNNETGAGKRGSSGGAGGGAGSGYKKSTTDGATYYDAENGLLGNGGNTTNKEQGGGGGGSFGNGGNGSTSTMKATAPGYGGGGGGGIGGPVGDCNNGSKGGDGYVVLYKGVSI